MKIGSLFSGIGGIELGFERAGGFTTEWFVENDIHAQALLRKHWPDAKIYADITQVDFTTVPKVDILTGGFPCQDISNAGKRAGITGSRSSLWKHYLRAIRILRPRYILAENVSALLNRGLDVVLSDLAEVGYDAEWHCISASSIGAPHKRDRIFILAYPKCLGCSKRPEECREFGNKESYDKFNNCSKDVGNSSLRSLERHDDGKSSTEQTKLERNDNRAASEQHGAGWWAVEPSVGRVAYGVPLRVERIKRLGNAVVPSCAEVFARAIKEYEEG